MAKKIQVDFESKANFLNSDLKLSKDENDLFISFKSLPFTNVFSGDKLLKKVDNILKKQKDVITLKIKKERILDENHEWGLGQIS